MLMIACSHANSFQQLQDKLRVASAMSVQLTSLGDTQVLRSPEIKHGKA